MIKFDWLDFTYKNVVFKKAGIYVTIYIENEPFYLQVDTGSFKSIFFRHKLDEFNLFAHELENAENIHFSYTNFSGLQKVISVDLLFSSNDKASIEFIVSEEESILENPPKSNKKNVDKKHLGILGNDYFAEKQIFNINYPKQEFSFNELPLNQKLITETSFEKHSNTALFNCEVNGFKTHCLFDTAASNFTIFSLSYLDKFIPNFRTLKTEEIEIFRPETSLLLYKVTENIELKIGGKVFLLTSFYYLEQVFDKELFHIETKGHCFIGNDLFKDYTVSIDFINNKLGLYNSTK